MIEQFRAMLTEAAEAGARVALASAGTPGSPDDLIPIKNDPLVSYRVYCTAIRNGELTAYRVGAKTAVRRADRDRWFASDAHRVQPRASAATEPTDEDEIGELIELSRRRQRG